MKTIQIVIILGCILMTSCNQTKTDIPSATEQVIKDPPSSKTPPPEMTPSSVTKSTPIETPKQEPLIKGTPIKDQSFPVSFEQFGGSQFITTTEKLNGKNRLHFYIKGPNGELELPYTPNNPEASYEMKAVTFKDINGDGLKDIVIIADFTAGVGYMGIIPISQLLIFTQTNSGFIESKSLEDHVRAVNPYRMLNIPTVLELLKADENSGYAEAWSKFPLGDYILNGSNKYNSSTLTIEKNTGDSIVFSVHAFHVTGGEKGLENGSVNLGDIDSGTATLSGDEMVFRDKDYKYELSISLLTNEDIFLSDNAVIYYGANVYVNGPYHKSDK